MEKRNAMRKNNSQAMLIAVGILLVWTAAFGDNLVRNGDFSLVENDKLAAWSIPPAGHYSHDKGGGINGSPGLRFENADVASQRPGYSGQALPLRNGKVYDFSAWIRARKSTAPGAKFGAFVMVEVITTNNVWLCEYRSGEVADTKGEWVQVKGTTPPIPANAGRCYIRAVVQGAGTAAFDNVAATPREEKPVWAIDSSAYQDTAWAGKVRFDARLGIEDAGKPLDAYRAVFAIADGKGATRRVPATAFTLQRASVELAVADLPLGTYPVSFELRAADGKKDVIGEATLDFTRTAGDPGRKVRIDEHNRFIVDGKPFFPLGFYHGNVPTNVLEEYCKGPFNCVLPYPSIPRSEFDLCQQRGLKVISCLIGYRRGFRNWEIPFQETQADADRAVVQRVRDVMDHPALLGWYLFDEAPINERDRLVARRDLIRRLDPDHPSFAVFCQKDAFPEYRGTCDVMGVDPYPIPHHPVGWAAEHARAASAAQRGGPVLQVVQAFDWGWEGSKAKDNRLPTYEEARSMAWQGIANGASGVIFYIWPNLRRHLKGADFDREWGAYCKLAGEISSVMPVLLAEPAANATGYPAGLSGRAWQRKDVYWLLVANETREDRVAKLRLPKRFKDFRSALGEAETSIDGEGIELELPPLGVALLGFKEP